MRTARIHIHMGVAEFPERTLGDDETTDDIIELQLNDNETVMQVDIDKQPTYRKVRREAHPNPLVPGQMLPARIQSTRDRTVVTYKYRVATIEQIDHINGGEIEEAAIVGSSAEITTT